MAYSDDVQETALARLFSHERASGSATWFSLPGGCPLYTPGEEADQLYFVRAGRLGAFRKDEGQERQFLGVIRPGEPAGEMAMIAGSPHSAFVVALRDSEILALPRQAFFDAADRDPAVMNELARLMILRMRQAATKTAVGAPSVFGFGALDAGPPIRPLVEAIERAVLKLGYSVTVIGSEALSAPTEWFSDVEQTHDFVLYVAEPGEMAWRHVIGRQVDRLFRIGHGDRPPPEEVDTEAHAAAPLQAQQLVDLILLHPADTKRPSGSEAWLDATNAARIFHMRDGFQPDIDRVARVITGESVGLVLSGGGARAYAHIGAIHALQEAGVPIDFVGGVSMGAMIAAGLALGWDREEMDRRIRKAFVESSPLDDITLPLIAMTLGQKVRDRLYEHFDDAQIADMWLPFFCVSSNLTTGNYQLHKRGLVRTALRASISLPGVLPPVTIDNNVLVDGAVLNNFPADVMRATHLGPVVGVDVTRGRSLDGDDVVRPESFWRWIFSGEWRKGPPIVALLMRAATVTTGRDLKASRDASDLLITPNIDNVDLRDWKAFEPGVEAGYIATKKALSELDRPVTELRRRASLAEQAAAEANAPAKTVLIKA